MEECSTGSLWMWILQYGGIKRSRDHWDSHLSINENRRRYRFLDRASGNGIALDCLAQEIGDMFPQYGIFDGADLWDWLGATV